MNNKDNQINWDRFESAFYASNTLVDGRYEGVTTSYSVFPSKKDDTPMFSLKVLVDNDGGNHEVAYITKFNFKNYYLKKLMEAFDIEVTLGQRPNFDSMCGVPVEVEVKTNGEFQNITSIKKLTVMSSSDILDMIFDSTDSVDTDDDLFL